jgi:hypothetical protein
MPFTQSDIDALKAAIVAGQGAKSITFSDQSVTFHSVAEMVALLAMMEKDVATTAGTHRSYRLAATSKGL